MIGRTPLVKINGHSNLYAKLEMFNPFGSVKDRAALQIINDAENSGKLKKGSVIVEATSGNLGISLTAIGAIKGYKSVIVMPENMSARRIKLINAFGGEVLLTDENRGMRGAIERAEEISSVRKAFMPCQFENLSGVLAHFLTTAPEIENQMADKIDFIVCGIGTGGTITGIANYFYGKDVKIIGVEPKKSPFLTKGYSGKHNIQGIGAGFCPSILDKDLIDDIITVSDDEAYDCARELKESNGLFIGISSGAVYAAVKKLEKRKGFHQKTTVMIFADGGDRYL